MIKPVTYQGVFNFNANLYALEVRSRFIDQSNANGYYKGYGDELAAKIVGKQIQIGTGAFVIQGRMNEVTATELISPQIFDGFVGYIVARVETFHPSDEENCKFVAYVNTSFDAIELQQDDIYAADADNVNKVYELPIYSFAISGNTITNLQKLIKPVEDYATVKAIVDNALATAQSVVAQSNKAASDAASAVATANTANGKSDTAVSTANAANTKANNAVSTANAAAATVEEQHEEMSAEIAALAQAIAEKQGTVVERNGVLLATYEVKNVLESTDTINLSGGNA